jgi:hypothetical protein
MFPLLLVDVLSCGQQTFADPGASVAKQRAIAADSEGIKVLAALVPVAFGPSASLEW